MSDALLALLRYCFLALLFVFLGRVVFVVIREIRASRAPVGEGTTTAAESTARARRTRDWRVVVIEPKAQAGREYVLAAENTVGRAAGCTISLEDEFVSTIHLRLFTADGALYAGKLKAGEVTKQKLDGKPAYLVPAKGRVEVKGSDGKLVTANTRDGVAVVDQDEIELKALEDAEIVLVETDQIN